MDEYLHTTNTKLGVFRDVIIEDDYNPLKTREHDIKIYTGKQCVHAGAHRHTHKHTHTHTHTHAHMYMRERYQDVNSTCMIPGVNHMQAWSQAQNMRARTFRLAEQLTHARATSHCATASPTQVK